MESRQQYELVKTKSLFSNKEQEQYKGLIYNYSTCLKFPYQKQYHFRIMYTAMLIFHLKKDILDQFDSSVKSLWHYFKTGQSIQKDISLLVQEINKHFKKDQQYFRNEQIPELMEILTKKQKSRLEQQFFNLFKTLLKLSETECLSDRKQIKTNLTKDGDKPYTGLNNIHKNEISQMVEIQMQTGKSQKIYYSLSIILDYFKFAFKFYHITIYDALELFEPIQEKQNSKSLDFLMYKDDLYILFRDGVQGMQEEKALKDSQSKQPSQPRGRQRERRKKAEINKKGEKLCNNCHDAYLIRGSKNTLCNPCVRKQCHICFKCANTQEEICYNVVCKCKYCYKCIIKAQKQRNNKPFKTCPQKGCQKDAVPGYIEEFVQNYEQIKKVNEEYKEQNSNSKQDKRKNSGTGEECCKCYEKTHEIKIFNILKCDECQISSCTKCEKQIFPINTVVYESELEDFCKCSCALCRQSSMDQFGFFCQSCSNTCQICKQSVNIFTLQNFIDCGHKICYNCLMSKLKGVNQLHSVLCLICRDNLSNSRNRNSYKRQYKY